MPRLVLAPIIGLTLVALMAGPARADDDDTELVPPIESLTQVPPPGLWLGTGLSTAWIDSDPYVGLSLGVGVEHDRFALHLRAPLWIRPFDIPPLDSPAAFSRASPVEKAVCGFVRCAEWTRDGAVEWGSLSRILDELRLGDDSDAIFVRGGPLHAHLGTGQLLNETWGSPEWDRRQAGLYARGRIPFAKSTFELVTPGVLTAYELVAARASARPFLPLSSSGADASAEDASAGVGDVVVEGLGRLEVAVEAAGDLLAPVADATVLPGGRALPVGTRPLTATAVEVTWPLFPSSWWVQVAPAVSGSAMWGLSQDGNGAAEFGGGTSGGARVGLSFPYVAASVEAFVGAQTAAHRAGVFGGLYILERRQALAGVGNSRGLLRVPAPGGVYARGQAEFVLADILRLGARLQLEDAPNADVAEAWADVAVWTVRAGARLMRRDLVTDRGLAPFLFGGTTLIALEARWAFWGPFAAEGRWMRLPRFHEGGLAIDDDVFVGVTANFVFGLQASMLDW